MTTKILIVGAGSVGQVYGHHLQKGGARLTYLLKSDKLDLAKTSFAMYRLGKKKAYPDPEILSDFAIVTEPPELGARDFDYVFICTSSIGLRAGTWFKELAQVLPDARFVIFAVGLDEFDFVSQFVPRHLIIVGLITMMSYTAPLPNENLEPSGTAYWFLPFSRFIFSGETRAVDHLVGLLNKGSMPSSRHANVLKQAAVNAPMLQMAVLALECAGWSLKTLAKDKVLRTLLRHAIIESVHIGAKKGGLAKPVFIDLLPSWAIIAILRLMRSLAPVSLEAFFEKHYTKVREQSGEILKRYIALGQDFQKSTLALETLDQLQKSIDHPEYFTLGS